MSCSLGGWYQCFGEQCDSIFRREEIYPTTMCHNTKDKNLQHTFQFIVNTHENVVNFKN